MIEILIAVSLMSVLAIMCWRGLETVVQARDRITNSGDQMQALSTAMAQLDEDFRRSQTLRRVLTRDPISFVKTEAGTILTIDRPMPGQDTGMMQRVQWRLNNKALERGFSAPVNPVDNQAFATVSLNWQPILENVDAWRLRAIRKNLRQWVDTQADLTIAPAPTATQGLAANDVVGVEMVLVPKAGEPNANLITRVFVLED